MGNQGNLQQDEQVTSGDDTDGEEMHTVIHVTGRDT